MYIGLYIFIKIAQMWCINILGETLNPIYKLYAHLLPSTPIPELIIWLSPSNIICALDTGSRETDHTSSFMCLTWGFVFMNWGIQYSILTSWDKSYVQQFWSLCDDLQNTTSMFFHVCTADYSRLCSWGQPCF